MAIKINIGNLMVRSPDGKINVDQHPYYLSLKYNDKHLYRDFVKQSNRQNKKKSALWSEYNNLKDIIYNKGFIYNVDHPVIIKYKKGKWYASHGRHRSCILRYLYGENCILVLTKLKDNKYVVRKVLQPSL